jgi:hypothetical protein
MSLIKLTIVIRLLASLKEPVKSEVTECIFKKSISHENIYKTYVRCLEGMNNEKRKELEIWKKKT